MTAAVYLRKSRADEVDPDALLRHRETLFAFAKANNINIIDVFEEIVSGENLYMRPQMLRLLQKIELQQYDAVLCMDIDRLGRGAMSSQGLILETIKNAGCKIITPRRVYDLNNEIDEQYSEFETFMARQEYKMITRRMRRGVTSSVKEGAHVGEVPFGYNRIWINDGKKPSLEINPETSKYVKLAFDMYVNLHVGCQQIADLFNTNGIKPKKSQSWGRTSIRLILRNQIYTGVSLYNRAKKQVKRKDGDKHGSTPNPSSEWIVIKGAFPAIISQEQFDRAQAIFEGRHHSAYFTGEFKNPLAGLMYCGVCGKKLQRRSQTSKNYIALMCPTPGCCKAIKLELAEQSILKSLKQEVKKMDSNKSIIKVNNADSKDALKKSLLRELEQIQTQRIKTYDLLEQGVYTLDVFTVRNSDLAMREKKAQAQLTQFEKETAKIIDFEEMRQRIKNVINSYGSANNVNEQNELLKSVLKRVDYYRPKGSPPKAFSIKLTYLS